MIREPPCHPRLRHHQPRPNVHKRRRSPSQRTVASPSLKRRPSFHPDGKSQLNLSGMAPQTEARIRKISLFVHDGKAMNNQQAFTKNTAGSRTKQPVQSVSKLASERFRNLIARIWTIPAHRSSDVLATAVRSWPIALWVMQNGLRKLLHRLCPVRFLPIPRQELVNLMLIGEATSPLVWAKEHVAWALAQRRRASEGRQSLAACAARLRLGCPASGCTISI